MSERSTLWRVSLAYLFLATLEIALRKALQIDERSWGKYKKLLTWWKISRRFSTATPSSNCAKRLAGSKIRNAWNLQTSKTSRRDVSSLIKSLMMVTSWVKLVLLAFPSDSEEESSSEESSLALLSDRAPQSLWTNLSHE